MLCPEEYMNNCWYADVYCHKCAARAEDTNPVGKLEYKPIDSSLPYSKHPYIVQLKKDKVEAKREETRNRRATDSFKKSSSDSRKGRKVERQVAKTIGGVMTLGSGAVLGDGDFTIGDHHVEHKLRINGKNTLGPTKAEWEKAVGQGCSIFMTTSGGQTIVTMTKETLMEIIDEAFIEKPD
jgi:hypothetical protein